MITEEYVSEEVTTPPVPEMVRDHLRPFVATIETTNGEFEQLPPFEENEGVLLTSKPVTAFRPWMVLLVLPIMFTCCIAGTGVGLLFGWEVWPVEWDVSQYHSALPYNLREDYRRIYVQSMSDLYAFNMDEANVKRAAGEQAALLPTVCQMMNEASESGDAPETIRLFAITYILGGCDALTTDGE